MPPKKRGRPPGIDARPTQPPAKRVRVGETSIIGTQDSSEATEPSRPRRVSAGEPNYSSKRARAPNGEKAGAKASASNSLISTADKASERYKKKGASTSFGKRQVSATARAEAETSETPKRGRGRPKKVPAMADVAVEKKVSTASKRFVSQPSSISKRPVGRPKKTLKDIKSVIAPALKRKGPATSVNHEGDEDEEEDLDTLSNGPADDDGEEGTEDPDPGRHYWLMKAEPNSRIVRGVDVKFSIDDLAAKAKPEAWDGVRNYGARNNMRLMRAGDLAFFYHSSCEVPGIAGIMEIVGEHTVDETAFDPSHPYYDPNSKPEKPKWDVVHVKYVRKFPKLLTLSDLRSFSKVGEALAQMQLLKQGRLSVSAVKAKEWDYILSLTEEETHEDGDEDEDEDADGVGQLEETLIETTGAYVDWSKDVEDSTPGNFVDGEALGDVDEDDGGDEENVDEKAGIEDVTGAGDVE